MNVTSTQSAAPMATATNTLPQVKVEADDSRITVDTSLSYTVEIRGRTEEEQRDFDYTSSVKHRDVPMLDADSSLKTIEDKLGKLQKALARERPDLARASWDVTIEDGQLKVTGALTKEDQEWLSERLNSDSGLKGAANVYMRSAVAYLQTDVDNPLHHAQNLHTGKMQLYNFQNVERQLEGKLSFKELIKTSWEAYRNPRTGEFGDPGNERGALSMDVLASRLTATPPEY